MKELKYVKLKNNSIIIFSPETSHDTFKWLNPVTAGFCRINLIGKRVDCYGNSYSLSLKCNKKEDTLELTKHVFGMEACLKLLK